MIKEKKVSGIKRILSRGEMKQIKGGADALDSFDTGGDDCTGNCQKSKSACATGCVCESSEEQPCIKKP